MIRKHLRQGDANCDCVSRTRQQAWSFPFWLFLCWHYHRHHGEIHWFFRFLGFCFHQQGSNWMQQFKNLRKTRKIAKPTKKKKGKMKAINWRWTLIPFQSLCQAKSVHWNSITPINWLPKYLTNLLKCQNAYTSGSIQICIHLLSFEEAPFPKF